ncbi:hypothetical protein QUF80_23120 [Desulfococcaceae bacterium HSG8]|nr:hypothetical protein [Desulfococcaceae bacterium HSG8]
MYRDQSNSECRTLITALLIILLLIPSMLFAGGREEWRVSAGLELFPSLLAADMDIAGKQGEDGKLLLLLTYVNKEKKAKEMADFLENIGKIRRIPIRVEIATSLEGYEKTRLAGIFLTQKIGSGLDAVLHYGKKQRVIIFSPFEGDVEYGASGGIVVSDRILPYINKKTLRLSGIRIKPIFLRIAEEYE